MNHENFVFLGSFKDTIDALQDDYLKLELAMAIIDYGTDYKLPDANQFPLIYALMQQIMYTIDNQKDRYANASKGGRPTKYSQEQFNELFAKGLTNKEIEEITQASHSTVERKKKIWKEHYSVENVEENVDVNLEENLKLKVDVKCGYEVLRSPQNTQEDNDDEFIRKIISGDI